MRSFFANVQTATAEIHNSKINSDSEKENITDDFWGDKPGETYEAEVTQGDDVQVIDDNEPDDENEEGNDDDDMDQEEENDCEANDKKDDVIHNEMG